MSFIWLPRIWGGGGGFWPALRKEGDWAVEQQTMRIEKNQTPQRFGLQSLGIPARYYFLGLCPVKVYTVLFPALLILLIELQHDLHDFIAVSLDEGIGLGELAEGESLR
jgi:hypothetical protein